MKYLIIVLLLTSCVTPKKAVDVLSRPKNEPVAAAFCSLKYPVRDSIIKGDSVVRFDTLWETYTDTLISEPQVVVETRIVPKTVTKTVVVRDTIIRENTAKVSVLNRQISVLYDTNYNLTKRLEKATTERDGYREQRDDWRKKAWLLLVIVCILYALKVKMTKKLW